MKLYTRALFFMLNKLLTPDLICDIGSMDGTEALLFKKGNIKSKVIAFEANTHNYKRMLNNKQITDFDISVYNLAVWKENGIIDFYLENTNKNENWRKGISSTKRRVENSIGYELIKVKSVRLDNFILSNYNDAKAISLWIDVEGASYEVLKGIENIKDRILLIHVEVETNTAWTEQKLKNDVINLTSKMNFMSIARGYNESQHDVILINTSLPIKTKRYIMIITALVKLLSQIIFYGIKLKKRLKSGH